MVRGKIMTSILPRTGLDASWSAEQVERIKDLQAEGGVVNYLSAVGNVALVELALVIDAFSHLTSAISSSPYLLTGDTASFWHAARSISYLAEAAINPVGLLAPAITVATADLFGITSRWEPAPLKTWQDRIKDFAKETKDRLEATPYAVAALKLAAAGSGIMAVAGAGTLIYRTATTTLTGQIIEGTKEILEEGKQRLFHLPAHWHDLSSLSQVATGLFTLATTFGVATGWREALKLVKETKSHLFDTAEVTRRQKINGEGDFLFLDREGNETTQITNRKAFEEISTNGNKDLVKGFRNLVGTLALTALCGFGAYSTWNHDYSNVLSVVEDKYNNFVASDLWSKNTVWDLGDIALYATGLGLLAKAALSPVKSIQAIFTPVETLKANKATAAFLAAIALRGVVNKQGYTFREIVSNVPVLKVLA